MGRSIYDSYMREDFAKVVRFGPEDVPDKYDMTKKMHAIYDLVEAEKALEEGGFMISAADVAFYDRYKSLYEGEKKNRGRPYKFPRYYMD